MSLARRVAFLVALPFLLAGFAAAAWADFPREWQLGFQQPASTTFLRVNAFHHWLLIAIIAISGFVFLLLLITIFRFHQSRHPVPTRTSHNTVVEVLWTVVPVLILVAIAIPSFRILYYADRTENAEMTLKATGHQWYWSYEYPDHGAFTFDALLVPDAELQPGQHRLLETDNEVVLPVDTNIRIQLTSDDVIHAWHIPAFAVKLDNVPGRLNETWVRIIAPGTYYGQCSELCGVGHAFMPIKVHAVTKEEFATWVADAQQRFARADGTPVPMEARLKVPAVSQNPQLSALPAATR